MRYRLVAVGRLKRGFYRDGCDHYAKRLGPLAPVEVLEVKEGRGEPTVRKDAEGAALLGLAKGRVVALDEKGRGYRSGELAQHLTQLEVTGESLLTLVLGGADGLSDEVLDGAHETWSLSPLTLPHELARLVLLEQLYRAETIRAGHPYHRE